MANKKKHEPVPLRKQISALNNSILALEEMHGSVVGDPSFPHVTPGRCECAYGETIRNLKVMRRTLYIALAVTKK